MSMSPNASLTIAGSLAAGILALTAARHLRTPGIIILLLVGVALGPDGLGYIEPRALGPILPMIVGIAVAIILFEGGLHLDIRRLKKEGVVINYLITVGAVITAITASIAAAYWMAWGWRISVLFGTLVIVTGPTVVTPLLRRLSINKNLQTILEAEGVLIDPIGAIIAVVALEFVLSSTETTIIAWLGVLGGKLFFGFVAGFIGGGIIGWLLKQEYLVPDELENTFTLGMVVLIFEASNALLHESGIMTVTIAGMVVGNMKIPMHRRLVEFKEQLTLMLIGILFVLLTADVRLIDIRTLGFAGVATVLTVMFVVRPLNVLGCTIRSDLNWKEKLFMSWLAPRGIVAAAVASLFAADLKAGGIAGGESLRALVFLVIATTVITQGLTARHLATLLGLRRKLKDGYFIVGANILGRTLAKHLQCANEEIILADRNSQDCQLAEQQGFQVIYGNALEEHLLQQAKVETKRGVIGITPNEGLNLLLIRRVRDRSKTPELFVTLNAGSAVKEEMIKRVNGHALFASQIDFSLWNHLFQNKQAVVESFDYQGKKPFILTPRLDVYAFGVNQVGILPLVVIGKNSLPVPAYDGLKIIKGDSIVIAISAADKNSCERWLQENNFFSSFAEKVY